MGLVEGIFVRRENRFVAAVEVKGKAVLAHVPTSGRMGELLTPGRRVLLAPASKPGRKTLYSLQLVDLGDRYVSIDSMLPNRLIYQALKTGALPELTGYQRISPEFSHDQSRFDFHLAGPEECYLEVKSVTLVEEGIARFPDAPTKRGTKHVKHLKELKQQGLRAGIIFVVQRQDALCFEPNRATDPDFSAALKEACAAGVEVWAYLCQVTEESIKLDLPIPVCV